MLQIRGVQHTFEQPFVPKRLDPERNTTAGGQETRTMRTLAK